MKSLAIDIYDIIEGKDEDVCDKGFSNFVWNNCNR